MAQCIPDGSEGRSREPVMAEVKAAQGPAAGDGCCRQGQYAFIADLQ